MRQGRRAWLVVAGLLVLPSLATWPTQGLALRALSWQPALAFSEPWRWWTAAWVHLSLKHLLANLAGAVLVAALGWAARVPPRAAWAWLLAWPLTHLGLLLQPALQRYGGLSGVLHAGVAVAAVHLLMLQERQARVLGAAILAGMALKIVLEGPWRGPLIHPPEWDIAVAPLAHLLGTACGCACAWVWLRGGPRRPGQNV
jgi:rhomboid family GlyGly-CTERM serine protease